MAKLGNNRGLLLIAGVLIGLIVGITIPFSRLSASSTHGSDEEGVRFAVCTAELEPGFEGVYYLDTRTGTLQAAFFNPRTSKLTAIYEYNILNDFKDVATKSPKFLMVSGSSPLRQLGNVRSSTGLIYIVEERSGMMCVYSAPYAGSRESAAPYKEKLVLVTNYKFGSQVIRDTK